MVNMQGEIFSKQGTPIQSFRLNSFFHVPSDNVSDPRVLFDQSSGRWFASIVTSRNANFNSGNVSIAVSTSNDPTGSWNIYVIPLSLSNRLPDQPVLGLSDDKLVVSVNTYDGGIVFLGAEYWVMNKSEMVAGAARIDTTSFGPDVSLASVHPVQSLSSTPTLYLVSTGTLDLGFNAPSLVKLISITGVPPATLSLQFYSLPISTINGPINGGVATNDFRVEDAAWFQGKLWLTTNSVCTPTGDTTGRACIRLTELDTTVPKVLQDFDFCTVGTNCYYGALRFDSQGSLALVYGFSTSNAFPSIAVTGQTVSDPVNTLRQPQTLVSGTATDTSGRYGDYFGASVDPVDQTLIWVNGEYHNNATGNCPGSGNCWSTFIGSMRVSANDFSISNTPTLASLTSGTAGTSTITLSVTSQNGFIGSVILAASVSPAGPAVSLNTTFVQINNPGSGAGVKLTITTSSSTLAGGYTVTMTGTTGSSIVAANIPLRVAGFGISTNPSALSIVGGASATSTVSLTNLYGFAGIVTLAASISAPGPTASLNPTSISLNLGQQGTSTLTISTSTSITTGMYQVTVTGTSGSQSHSAAAVFFVTPVTISVNNVQSFTGYNIKTVEALSVDAPSTTLTLSGTASIVATNSTTNAVVFSNNYTITRFPIVSGNVYISALIFNITASPYPISSETFTWFSPNSPPSSSLQVFPERNPDINENGIVDQADYNTVAAIAGCRVGMSCYNPRADINANGVIDINDVSIVGAAVGFPNIVPNFAITPSQSSVTIAPSSQFGVGLSLASLDGFAGTVNLAASVTPAGLTASFSSSSVTLAKGGTGTATLTVSSPNLSFYNVNVTATSGVVSRSVVIPVHVVFFTINPFPQSISVIPGQTGMLQRTVSSVFDFQGTVNVTATISVGPQGNRPTIFFSPATVFVPFENGTITTMIVQTTTNTVGGGYFVTITGTSGLITNSQVVVEVDIENFALAAIPNQVTFRAGSQGSSLINVTQYNFFINTVNLAVSSSPAGISCSLNATSVSLSFSTPFGKSLLTCSSTTGNVYTVTVIGTASFTGLTHSVTATFTVQDFGLSASPTTLSIPKGSSGHSTITLSSINSWSGTVALSATISPIVSKGPTVSLSTTSITLTAGGQGTSTLTVFTINGTPKGTYTVTVTATSGSVVHTFTITVTVS
jgi:uncharacterized membrane protein